jgi:hypothetical protein
MAEQELLDTLRRSGGLEAVSRELGIPPATAFAGAEAMLPAILGGFRKRTESFGGAEGGLGQLIDLLGGLGGGKLAASVLAPEPTDLDRGNNLLSEIFGSRDVSLTLAKTAAERTGIDPATLQAILPRLAMLVGGYLAARAGGSGAAGSGGLSGVSEILADSGGGLGRLLDLDGDGNPLDDIIDMAGKMFK